jgi:hypothetical protein
MEAALLSRADGGVNADPPLADRIKPRVSAVTSLDAYAIACYMRGAEKAPMDVSYAANTQTGQAMEDLIVGLLGEALGIEWDLFDNGPPTPGREDYDYTWQPGRWDCGPAIGRPDAVSVEHGIIADAKSASATQFAMNTKDNGEQYRIQQTLYLAGAEAKYGKPFKSLVAVMNKETKKGTPQAFAVFEFLPDPALVAKVAAVVEQAKNGNARCPYPASDWHPRYCAYRGQPGCGGSK